MFLRKRFLALAMTVSIAGSSFLPVLAQSFGDLRQDYWAYDSIQTLSQQNILSGYSDSTFRPDNPVTRAEFATMIIKAMDKENKPIGQRYNFKDVSSSFWADSNIQRAYDLGLITGFPNGTFKPYDYITRTEVMAILSKSAQSGYLSTSEAEQVLSRFYDENRVPDWAKVSVAKAVKANLVVNYPQPNFLMPEKKATRAEVAAMLLNMRKELGLQPVAAPAQTAQPAQTYPQQGTGYNQQNPYYGQQPYGQGYQQAPQQSYQQPAIVDQVSQAAASGATTDIVLRGSIATIQEDSVIPTVLETPLSSEIASVGDAVVLRVNKNVATSQGVLLVPAGSRIQGKIKAVTPAKLGNRNAKIDIDFYQITMPNGQSAPLVASIATESGMLEAGSLKGNLAKGLLTTVGGAGAGAALGTALGAITGNVGKGAIYGTAIGGGLGAVGATLAQGGAIQIPSGEALFIKLERPISVDINTGSVIPQ